jgi:hypothetical protein
MIIRFVRGTAWESTAIALQEKSCMPFVPSHVEALTPDGAFYIGAHIDGGVQARSVGYDEGQIAKLPDGYDAAVFPAGLCDMRFELSATPAEDRAFYGFLAGKINQPYDWRAILGFLLPEHEHQPKHAICSALVTLGLRSCGWFPWRLAAPAHVIDPRDLLLMLSTHMQIPGV